VGISISYGLFMIGRMQTDDLRAPISPRYAARKLQRDFPYRASFEYLNSEPSVREVLILDRSVPAYYSNKAYIKPAGQRGERSVPGASTSLEALQKARQLGVTHVLDVVSSVSDFQVKSPPAGLTLVFQSAAQRVYRVNEGRATTVWRTFVRPRNSFSAGSPRCGGGHCLLPSGRRCLCDSTCWG
jgi:hypothetical protein